MKAHSGEELGVPASGPQASSLLKTSLHNSTRPWEGEGERGGIHDVVGCWRDVLPEAEKSLAPVEASQDAIRSSCDQVVSQHEASVKVFAEGLKAWADAAQVLQSETGELSGRCFLNSGEFNCIFAEHSAALAQLALRIFVVVKFRAGAGEDPFVKVKALVTDLNNKLQAGASSDASQK